MGQDEGVFGSQRRQQRGRQLRPSIRVHRVPQLRRSRICQRNATKRPSPEKILFVQSGLQKQLHEERIGMRLLIFFG